ncbi:7TM-DISM domain-containing protein [beta proteobacterium MWH-UniP1]
MLTLLQRAAIAALCFFCVTVVWPRAALADDTNHVVAQAWFEDPSNKLTFAEIQEKPFTPYQWFLSKGFGDSTIWVRLTIDPHSDKTVVGPAARSLILKIRPLYIDEIELFDPADPSGLRRITGDQFPARAAEYQSLNFNFVIPRGETERDIYLRVRSTSTRLLYVQAYHLTDLQREDRSQQLLFGLYLSLVSLFLGWAAITWLSTRDPVISAFLVTQFFSLCLGLSIFGYVRDFFGSVWPPSVINQITSYSSVLIVTSAIFFYYRFWQEYKPANVLLKALGVFFVIGLVNFVLLLFGQIRLALQINMTLVLVVPFVTFAMVFTAKGWRLRQPDQPPLVPRWLVFMYFAANLLVLLAGALPGLGLASGGAYSIYVGLAHGIINGAFAVGILQYRSYLLSQKRAALAMELTMAQQEVQQERAFREERERLLAMLAHELRTPLATVRLLVGEQQLNEESIRQIKRSVAEMSLVIERSVQVNQLDESKLTPDISEIDAVGEISDIVSGTIENWSAIDLNAPASLRIRTDAQFFRMVISNLIDNALKYREEGTGVGITVTPRDDQHAIELVVENTPGPAGFPDPAQVYNKYYRSPMAYRQTGSGLGMYLVKGLLAVLKGKIDYRPTADKVRFFVWLPNSLS